MLTATVADLILAACCVVSYFGIGLGSVLFFFRTIWSDPQLKDFEKIGIFAFIFFFWPIAAFIREYGKRRK